MRSLLALLVLACAVSASASAVADPDDLALAELGVDLTHSLPPSPTYTSIKPVGHDDATIAKFPMLHEIKGLEAKDWSDIQGLLFREPPSAAESNLDMKLDELEVKFNKIDAMPVPSSIAPKGSTLLPKKKVVELGLKATLPKSSQPRLQQKAKKEKKDKKVAQVAPKTEQKSLKATVRSTQGAAKKASKSTKKAESSSSAADTANVRATVSTVKLIEKRIKGLSTLFQRLKTQIGMDSKPAVSSAQRLKFALSKHRKDKKELKARMAARKARFAQVDLDAEADAEAENEAEAETESESADSLMESDSEAEVEGEAEVETEAESEAELRADAEAVDEILQTLM